MAAELIFDAELHQYSVNGRIVPSVTQILAGVGLSDYDDVPRHILEVAQERGSIVHTYIEWYERGVLDYDSIDPALEGYFNAYLKCRVNENFPEPDAVENRVYSAQYGYAGTYDMLFGGTWLHDHKTGVKSPVHGLQQTGYWVAEHPDIRIKPSRLTCGYYHDDGDYELVDYPYEPLIWMAVLTEYNWRKKHNLLKN